MVSKTLQDQYENWFNSVVRIPQSAKVPLVTAFNQLYRNDRKQALRQVNKACGTNYNLHRYREWERGATRIPANTTLHMQQEVVKARFGLPGKALLKLLNLQGANSDLL